MELLTDTVSNSFYEEKEASCPVISSKAHHYAVGDMLGQGSFGKVVKCLNLQNGTPVAIKIQQAKYYAKREVDMMSKIQHLDPDRYNLVRFYESFQRGDNSYLVFESLDKTLCEFKMETGQLSLCELRPIMQQLFVALEGLKSVGIVHGDITLNNIMLVNHKEEPFRVKLIDFGCAALASEVKVRMPIPEAIDMLSLGLAMSSMVMGPLLQEQEADCYILRRITDAPRQSQADANDTKTFFKYGNVWRFKIPKEWETIRNKEVMNTLKILYRTINYYEESNWLEYVDFCEYVDLLNKMIKEDPRERITPTEALQHNFITNKYLLEVCPYIQHCFHTMQVCARDQHMDSRHGHTASDSNNTGLDNSIFDRAPVSVSDSDSSKKCLISSNGNVETPTDCEGAVGGDPSTDSVVVQGCWNGRDGIDNDRRLQGCESPETTDGGEIKPCKRTQRFFSSVFSKLFQAYKKIQNVFSRVVRTIFCRNSHPSNDDNIALVTSSCNKPSVSNPWVSGLQSLHCVTADFATPNTQGEEDVKPLKKRPRI